MNNFSKISEREIELVNIYNYILCNCIKINDNVDMRLYKSTKSNKDVIVIYNLLHDELVCLFKETLDKVIDNSIDLYFPKNKQKGFQAKKISWQNKKTQIK